MSVQASLNITGVVTNTKTSSNADSASSTTELSKENQLFSDIIGNVIGDSSQQLTASDNSSSEAAGEFIGLAPLDTDTNLFLSAASLDRLEGKLLPLLSGDISNLALDVTSPLGIQAVSLDSKTESVTNAASLVAPLLSGSNTLLEQLRSLLTGANTAGDSAAVTELRTQLVSLLDDKQSKLNGAAEQVLPRGDVVRNAVLSEQSQTSLRQEINATLSNVRGVFNDFFDLNQAFFDTAQKKPVGFDELLATLTKTNLSSVTNSANVNTNPILTQIASLINGSATIAQPLLGVVTETSSLQPSNPTQTQVTVPLNSSRWSDELGQRVRWLVGQNIGSAQIRLNPAELGPIQLRINVSGDQVSVVFNSQFGVVREAIEAALPKLREMLESQGLNLADADINQGDTAERQSKEGMNTAVSNGKILDSTIEGDELLASDVDSGVMGLNSFNLVDQFV
ncbi:MAG: flagellar hook-length control protein FliK [Gammaproteobacteria bacterium]|nr:flagellar hook-length control protein FliK [Gammaproteobacteria bacterium]